MWRLAVDESACYESHSPDDLTDVGGDKVADELLHVVVDSSALLNSSHNGREVVVSEDHLRGRLGNSSARAHGDTDLGLLQGRGIVHTITSLERGAVDACVQILFNFTHVQRTTGHRTTHRTAEKPHGPQLCEVGLYFTLLSSHHGGDVIVSLQELDNLGFVGWLDTGKAAGPAHSIGLFVQGQVVKLASGVGLVLNILILLEDANTTADGDSGSLVVT